MEPRIYRESGRKVLIHGAAGVCMILVALAASLDGLFLLLLVAGCIVSAMAALEILRRITGLSEYVRVTRESVDYVNPLNKSASVSLGFLEITAARFEKKPFGLTRKSTEMCAVIEISSGRKLTLTERFLPAETLEALVADVRMLIESRPARREDAGLGSAPAVPGPGPAPESGCGAEGGPVEEAK